MPRLPAKANAPAQWTCRGRRLRPGSGKFGDREIGAFAILLAIACHNLQVVDTG